MHSSRAAFSSLHTQQGFTFSAPSLPCGLSSEARLEVVDVFEGPAMGSGPRRKWVWGGERTCGRGVVGGCLGGHFVEVWTCSLMKCFHFKKLFCTD